ncbi:MAG: hypothetical protein H6707_14350 [Deltaproteobacteria bacterium]|nr:hypothetical protein [Deltaproteobacteria bacterium]
MRLPQLSFVCSLLCLALTSCGGPLRLVEPRMVPRAATSPKIAELVDLGIPTVTRNSVIALTGRDERAVIGEALLIKGSGFGRQPSVSIGETPAPLVGLVKGGLIVRVPWGIDGGQRRVRVSNHRGAAQATLDVTRLLTIATGSALHLFSTSGARFDTLALSKPIAALAMTTDGARALVGTNDPPTLAIIDLTASKLKVESRRSLPGKRVIAIASASHAPLGAVLTDTHIVLIDQRRADALALYRPRPLPPISLPTAIALSPQGEQLVVTERRSNRAWLIPVEGQADVQPTDMLPGVALEMLHSVRFAADGKQVWAIAGDSLQSISGGSQATRIVAASATGSLTVGDTNTLPGILAPSHVVVARADPTPPGTAIRIAKGNAALYLTTRAIGKQTAKSQLVRWEAGAGPKVLLDDRSLCGPLAIAGKTQTVFALTCDNNKIGLLAQKAWASDPAQHSDLGLALAKPVQLVSQP